MKQGSCPSGTGCTGTLFEQLAALQRADSGARLDSYLRRLARTEQYLDQAGQELSG
jgi:hypothetical protein